PNNPTGSVFPEAALREVNALCARHGLFHISDEVYEYFTYGSAVHTSPGAFDGAHAHTISMFSLSKAYGFAGWRIGYMVYLEGRRGAIAKVRARGPAAPPVLSQIAAVAAMEAGPAYCRQHVQPLAAVRDIVLSELRDLEPLCTVPAAEGAFYCFLRVNADVEPFPIAQRLIREHGVAIVPGDAFGATDGCYFRIAYGALQKATVAEGVGRLVKGLRVLLEKVKS